MSTRSHRSSQFNSSRKQFLKAFGKKIEEYDSIKRAVEAVGEVTKSNYYRELPNYFLFLNENPDTVILNRRKHLSSNNLEFEDYYEQRTRVYIKVLKEKGLAGRGISGIVGRIQGFFSNNSKRYSLDLGRLRVSKARKNVKYSPSNEEVRQLVAHADLKRDVLITTLAYQTGAAPVDISELCGDDLPRKTWVYFEKTRSKTGEVWRGVATPDIVLALDAYLKVRGEPVKGELLFKSREGYLDNDAVSRVVFDLIRKAGFGGIKGFKPTSLRDAFEDALVDANVKPKVKAALMAHTSGIEHEYGGNRKMVERLTEAMQKAYPFLCLNDSSLDSSRLAGFSGEDAEKMKRLLDQYDKFMQLSDWIERKEVYRINDPELIERLRKEGKI